MSTAGQLRPPPVFGEAFGQRLEFDNKPATDTAWYDMPGMTVTLPEAGTYAVTTEVTGQTAILPNTSIAILQRLLVNGAPLTNSDRFVLHTGEAGTGGSSTYTAVRSARTACHFVTAAAGVIVKVQVQRLAGAVNGAALSPGQPYTGVLGTGEGGARIEYRKIAD
ncbi:hypothetical protein [Streptomyces sp. NBC_00519]|uniref:hypothetical protein n=1 Tax=Streptomyces sp. NBC_00519 TaxID=2975764 RepID=UPI0030E3CB67